jgi:hydroxyacyl-ACP dehydratase HTD2-like protein with hotdog domain
MSSLSADWQHLALPLAIPPLVVQPTREQLFMFSAATWNRHHIHYDQAAARAEGFEDVVVHRALIGNFFARLLGSWLGDRGAIRRLNWKVTASAIPGRALHCHGVARERATAGDAVGLLCDLRMLDGEKRAIASGSAVVVPAVTRV